ncbi:hypothetical protein CGCSCA1_v014695 [Colletotrichum siamense]|nr:hypothetical protein CGCSCA1_v014695 [Colletotrichum siamense]
MKFVTLILVLSPLSVLGQYCKPPPSNCEAWDCASSRSCFYDDGRAKCSGTRLACCKATPEDPGAGGYCY